MDIGYVCTRYQPDVAPSWSEHGHSRYRQGLRSPAPVADRQPDRCRPGQWHSATVLTVSRHGSRHCTFALMSSRIRSSIHRQFPAVSALIRSQLHRLPTRGLFRGRLPFWTRSGTSEESMMMRDGHQMGAFQALFPSSRWSRLRG